MVNIPQRNIVVQVIRTLSREEFEKVFGRSLDIVFSLTPYAGVRTTFGRTERGIKELGGNTKKSPLPLTS